MGRINSKQKGNRGEREVVKILNEFYKTDLFKRVPNSGAYGTIHKQTLNEAEMNVLVGDIICPEWFHYSIEVKNVKNVDLYKIFETGKTPWDEQLEKERKLLKKSKRNGVILIFKQSRKCWLAMIDRLEIASPNYYPKMEMKNNKIIVKFEDLLHLTLPYKRY